MTAEKTTLTEFENKIEHYLATDLLSGGTYNQPRHRVKYDYAQHRLNFMAACYTRSVDDPVLGKYRRQDIFAEMRSVLTPGAAVQVVSVPSVCNYQNYPWGTNHNVSLVHDAKNEYDPKALMLILNSVNCSTLRKWSGRNLGYVPACLVPLIFDNRHLMPSIKIFGMDDKIRDNKGRTYMNLEMVIQLDETPEFKAQAFDQSRLRFGALL